MEHKLQHEQDYDKKLCIDCPHCGHDRPDHSCLNCYSDMNKETCWKNKGYCSEKCLKYVTQEIPKQRQLKINAGIKCQCDDSFCAKCLSINCKDDNCPTHTNEKKLRYRTKQQ